MKAGVLITAFLLIAIVPAQGHGGGGGGGHGGGHSGGHSGGHGFHFGRHHGGRDDTKATSSLWNLAPVTSLRPGDNLLVTAFVGFGSAPGLRVGFFADNFFCPFAPHFVPPFCPVCTFSPFGLRPGFFGFSGFGFFGDGGYWPGFDNSSQPITIASPSDASRKLAVLVFRNGWSFEVTDYGIDDAGELRYVTSYGGVSTVPVDTLDFYATLKANEQRGVPFALKLESRQ
jgi:hypothetical protein